jgi:hypothetical protein
VAPVSSIGAVSLSTRSPHSWNGQKADFRVRSPALRNDSRPLTMQHRRLLHKVAGALGEKGMNMTSDAPPLHLEYLAKSLSSFLKDPPDSDYQRGYRGALEEMLRVSASWIGVPYNRTETTGTILHKLLKQFPKDTLHQQALNFLTAEGAAFLEQRRVLNTILTRIHEPDASPDLRTPKPKHRGVSGKQDDRRTTYNSERLDPSVRAAGRARRPNEDMRDMRDM